MGIITKGMGAIIKKLGSKKVINRTTGKPFPKSIQDHMKAADKRRAGMKKAGYKREPYQIASSKTKGEDTTHKLKEMWSYNPYKKPKKSKLGKIIKKTAPIGGAAAAGEAYGRHREKSKTDVPEEITALVTGTRKVSKNQKKFKK